MTLSHRKFKRSHCQFFVNPAAALLSLGGGRDRKPQIPGEKSANGRISGQFKFTLMLMKIIIGIDIDMTKVASSKITR